MSATDMKAAPSQACPHCSGLIKEIGHTPHPAYANLGNVTFRCEACGHELEGRASRPIQSD